MEQNEIQVPVICGNCGNTLFFTARLDTSCGFNVFCPNCGATTFGAYSYDRFGVKIQPGTRTSGGNPNKKWDDNFSC